jgi:hypothetical protein
MDGDRPVDRRALDEIWSRLITDGVADPTDQSAAAAALAAHESWWSDLLADARLDGLLRRIATAEDEAEIFVRGVTDRLRAERDGDAFVERISRRIGREAPAARTPRSRRPMVWAAAAVGLAGVAALVVIGRRSGQVAGVATMEPQAARPQPPAAPPPDPAARPPSPEGAAPPIAALTRAEGTVFVLEGTTRRKALPEAEPLRGHEGIATVGDGSGARVEYRDGTVLELGPSTIATSFAPAPGGARSVFVASGSLRAAVARREGTAPVRVATPHAESILESGRFALSVSARATTLDVIDGAAAVRAPSKADSVRVAASERATVSDGAAIARSRAPRDDVATLVVGAVPLGASDDLLKRRLEKLGLEVAVRSDASLDDADSTFGAVVAISESVESLDVSTRFRKVAVPVLLLEYALLPDMGMTGREHHDELGSLRLKSGSIRIDSPGHPIAAGFTKTVLAFGAPTRVNWGVPSAFAARIAGGLEPSEESVIFAYERGSPMASLAAPARRVAFLLDDAAVARLTEDGWQIFDAAVRWCLADRRP